MFPFSPTERLEHFKCGHRHCLGPLTFHKKALGTELSLSVNDRYAERKRETYQNGLAFSNRPLGIQERVHLRVERCDQHWNGTLRVGFTSIPPPSFPVCPSVLPMPDLTATVGYWACPLPTSHTGPEAELCFWVTRRGVMKYVGPDGVKHKLLQGVDVTRRLWAMIDVYGQTRAVLLLRSEKKGKFSRKSCPVLSSVPASQGDSCMCVSRGRPCRTPHDYKLPSSLYPDPDDCVVCLSASACVTLPCGHRCLCSVCANRVSVEFGNCPLCRHPLTDNDIELTES
ncbi:E3 ubiquitin-protein ligase NEURL3-like [Polymixia lowei]